MVLLVKSDDKIQRGSLKHNFGPNLRPNFHRSLQFECSFSRSLLLWIVTTWFYTYGICNGMYGYWLVLAAYTDIFWVCIVNLMKKMQRNKKFSYLMPMQRSAFVSFAKCLVWRFDECYRWCQKCLYEVQQLLNKSISPWAAVVGEEIASSAN